MPSTPWRIAPALAAAAILAATGTANAQEYPNKPIRWVIPYAPGGATDITARNMAPRMAASLGQQVIVDNRAGGAAIPGFDIVAKAPPDGYTWLLANIAFGANPSLFNKLPFDVERDFAPVSKVAVVPMVLVVHPSIPANSMQDLLKLARARPGTLNYGSAGNGSANHLTTEVFRSFTKIDIVHVPYKGGGPAVADLVGGQLSLMFATISSSSAFVKQGRLRALAISNFRRNAALPDLPTLDELGLKGFNVNEWQVLVVPAGTPAAIIDRLYREVVKTLADPVVKERLAGLGAEAEGTNPQEATQFVKSELALWRKVSREAGIKTVD
jgi:tripartite-type tricarboxylate transporter receptor subunit TctC